MRNVTDLKVQVFTGSFAVGGNGAAANDFDITDALSKFSWVGYVTLVWKVARSGGSSTTDLTITTSADGGTSYVTLVAFTQISGATGGEVKLIAPPCNKALYKTDINLGSGTTSTITLWAMGKVAGPVLDA